MNDQERRQAWRETDGFAKASDTARGRFDTASGDINPLKDPRARAEGQAENPLVRYHSETYALGRSPLFIQIALGFYTQLDYQPPPFEAQRRICEEMVRLGLLRHDPVDGATYPHFVAVHESLKIYVEALCSVPLPVKRWVMP